MSSDQSLFELFSAPADQQSYSTTIRCKKRRKDLGQEGSNAFPICAEMAQYNRIPYRSYLGTHCGDLPAMDFDRKIAGYGQPVKSAAPGRHRPKDLFPGRNRDVDALDGMGDQRSHDPGNRSKEILLHRMFSSPGIGHLVKHNPD